MSFVERGTAADGIYEQFDEDAMQYTVLGDGMPGVMPGIGDGAAPPITQENLVCLPDLRKFVLRDRWGFVLLELSPSEVTRAPNAKYFASSLVFALQKAARQSKFTALQVFARIRGGRLEVVPVRERCAHFGRQMSEARTKQDAVQTHRLCMARRDDMGNFLSVGDSAMYACELREPYDIETMERIERSDERLIQLGRQRQEEEADLFDVDAHLANLARKSAGLIER